MSLCNGDMSELYQGNFYHKYLIGFKFKMILLEFLYRSSSLFILHIITVLFEIATACKHEIHANFLYKVAHYGVFTLNLTSTKKKKNHFDLQ